MGRFLGILRTYRATTVGHRASIIYYSTGLELCVQNNQYYCLSRPTSEEVSYLYFYLYLSIVLHGKKDMQLIVHLYLIGTSPVVKLHFDVGFAMRWRCVSPVDYVVNCNT